MKKPFWHNFPTYGDVNEIDKIKKMNLRISPSEGADPGWGPYAQIQGAAHAPEQAATIKAAGSNPVAWMEGYGTCFIYAAAFKKMPDGSLEKVSDEQMENLKPVLNGLVHDGDKLTKMAENSWGWEKIVDEDGLLDPDKYEFAWVGPHALVNDENYMQPILNSKRYGLVMPTYPNGELAVGQTDKGERYPLDSKFYDAVCSKDINGMIDKYGEGLSQPAIANRPSPDTAPVTDGLYRLIVTENDKVYLPPELKVGDSLYVGTIGIGKDPAAPFWRDYFKTAAKNFVRLGLKGLWVDNCSPFNNFGLIPLQNGFGEWSVATFNTFLKEKFTADELSEMGIDLNNFDVRTYLKNKATEFGAKDATLYTDKAWSLGKWLDEPVWNAYKVHKQGVGQRGMQHLYNSIKNTTAAEGEKEFCVMSNDMPWSLGWLREDFFDIVSAEVSPGWSIMGGGRGFMMPPNGRISPYYRAAHAHSKSPYATFWYYIHEHNLVDNSNLSNVLSAEAFASASFLKSNGNSAYPGNEESVVFWNGFVTKNEEAFGERNFYSDIGVLFSPDNQLAYVPPAHCAINHDRQPHIFGHWGFTTAMVNAHMSYQVVTDWQLSEERLAGLKTFIIPNAECLDDKVLPILEKWVDNGGRLVVTGTTGIRYGVDNMFKLRDNGSLIDGLLGEQKVQGTGMNGDTAGDLIIFVTDATDVRKIDVIDNDGAKIKASTNNASVFVNTYGKGTVVYTPSTIDMEYYINDGDREKLLPQMLKLIGDFDILSPINIPWSVGAYCFADASQNAVYADLVNFNLNLDSDVLTPCSSVEFKVKTISNDKPKLELLTPDSGTTAKITDVEGEYVSVKVENLMTYASVKIVR